MATEFQKAFETEKWILSLFGFYPQWNPEPLWKHARRVFCIAVTLTYIISMCTGPFLENSVMILCTVMGLSKMVQLLTSKRQFREIEHYISNMKPSIIRRSSLIGAFRVSVVTLVGFLGIMPLSMKNQRMLPYKSWLPYSVEGASPYYSTFIFEVISIVMAAFTNSTIDMMYYCLVDICCAELDVLKLNIIEIDMSDHVDIVEDELKKIVIHHHKIIRLVGIIQEIFSSVVFVQCMASVLVICFLGFQLIYVDKLPSVKALIELSFIACMLIQIFCYCWFGHNITMKSSEVGDICYHTKWFESDLMIRKIILIIMERCKKPVELRAKIFTLNLQTLLAILRSSYSYMAILRTLYTDE
uniref:Odorant receptor n=1 Tax=Colaphellus bowringi TaxID=561076 RepID=A0A0S3J2T4_9CUCU|nr:odorant receptor OR14 [Colaphellus bowringi]